MNYSTTRITLLLKVVAGIPSFAIDAHLNDPMNQDIEALPRLLLHDIAGPLCVLSYADILKNDLPDDFVLLVKKAMAEYEGVRELFYERRPTKPQGVKTLFMWPGAPETDFIHWAHRNNNLSPHLKMAIWYVQALNGIGAHSLPFFRVIHTRSAALSVPPDAQRMIDALMQGVRQTIVLIENLSRLTTGDIILASGLKEPVQAWLGYLDEQGPGALRDGAISVFWRLLKSAQEMEARDPGPLRRVGQSIQYAREFQKTMEHPLIVDQIHQPPCDGQPIPSDIRSQ